jgi:hypothetical protein
MLNGEIRRSQDWLDTQMDVEQLEKFLLEAPRGESWQIDDMKDRLRYMRSLSALARDWALRLKDPHHAYRIARMVGHEAFRMIPGLKA